MAYKQRDTKSRRRCKMGPSHAVQTPTAEQYLSTWETSPEIYDPDGDEISIFDMPMPLDLDLGSDHKLAGEITGFTLKRFLQLWLEFSPQGDSRSSSKSKRGVDVHEKWMATKGGRANTPPLHFLPCPFYVKNPEKYPSCLTRSTLREPREVKQHLWNDHQLPQYCPTCREIFATTKERDSHIRRRSCSPRDIPLPEGISIEQMQQLAQRAGPWASEKQQWLSIWTIVFPGAGVPSFNYPSSRKEFVVCLFRDYWASNGERDTLDFLESIGQYELLDDFAALRTTVLHQSIDRLVEYFR